MNQATGGYQQVYMKQGLRFYSGLLLLALLCSSLLDGWAIDAPSKDAEQQQCEPIRREILRINQKSRFVRPFYQPRLAHLKKRYGRCFQSIQTEEFNYLKQAEIPNHAGPKLPTLPEKTGRKRWWWPWS